MKKLTFSFLYVLLIIPCLFAQESKISGELDNPLPVDENIRIGFLDNGLKYYIRKNVKPEQRVEMRLVVNAGSMMEDEDQLGLAHFVEHMAFNGTKNFEKNDIVDYLQSIGVQFGADLNAYTSFDETVYILPIPTEDPEVVEKGMQVLEDWAHNVTFTEEEIDKERGVVLEEWRLGRGADQRMRDEYFPILFKESRYADRLPIGTKEVIENASYETIRKFYRDWYRPDMMAVVAIGDIDVDEMEKKIKDHFSALTNPSEPRERMVYPVPDHDQTFIALASDKEAPYTIIRLYYKADNVESKTYKDYRRNATFQLYNGMLNQRLQELTQSPDPPFLFGSTSFGSLVRTKSAYSSFAVVGETGIERGLKTLIEENQRVLQFGFTQGELDRYKKQILNQYEQYYNERDKSESRIYAAEYIRNFLTQETIPGIEWEFDAMKAFLPTIELEEVNALASKWITDENRVVIVTGPEKEGVVQPTEDEIRKMLDEADNMEITAYVEEEIGSDLMPELPEPGKKLFTKKLSKVGATQISFSNGVKVVLKPTDFKNDEILMTAFSPGGTSLYADEDYLSAGNASSIISESGVGEFSPTDLDKLFAGQTVSASPYVGSLTEGLNGSAAPKDLETMLQLVHMYFTSPKKDQDAFTSYITKNKMFLQNVMSNPNFYFQDQVGRIMSQNHLRGGGFPTMEDMENIDFEKSFEIYKERFADASDFTFFFVGNFNIEEITPMLELYLGSLPSLKRKETWVDRGVRAPKGVVEKVVNKGTDPKSVVIINFTGKKDYSKKENYDLSSLGEVLSIKLIEILREEKSGVYGVGASGQSSKFPEESYTFRISFPCAPENVDELVAATFDEIEKIKKDGVSDEDIQKIRETQIKNREENLKQNRFWLNQLSAYYRNGTDLETFYDREKLTENVNSKDLQVAANKYLNMDNYVKVVLMPEE
jgi:zinc protease